MTVTEIRDELVTITARLRALEDALHPLSQLPDAHDRDYAMRALERLETARDILQWAGIKIEVAHKLPDAEEAKSESL